MQTASVHADSFSPLQTHAAGTPAPAATADALSHYQLIRRHGAVVPF